MAEEVETMVAMEMMVAGVMVVAKVLMMVEAKLMVGKRKRTTARFLIVRQFCSFSQK